MNTQQGNELNLSPLKRALEDCRGAFYLMSFITLLITVFSIAPILYMMNVFDRVLSTNSTVTLVSLLVLVMGLYVFWTALEWLRTRLMIRISLRIDWDMAADVFDACFKKSLQHKDPNVHQVMADMLTLRQFMTGNQIITLIDGPFALFFIVIGFLVHPLLALFMVGATVVMAAAALFTKKATSPALRAASDNGAEANRLAAAGLKHAETALAMGMLPNLRKRWHGKHRTFLQYQVNASEANGFVSMFSGVLTKAMPTLQMTVGVLLAGAGLISAGGVIAATFLISKAVGPLSDLISKWEDMIKARMAYERLDALLSAHEKSESKMSLPAPKGHLQAANLHVNAPTNQREILKALNFELPVGATLAVVGPNAAGKSTLLKTIVGVWKPSAGAMRLDGADVYEWSHEELGPYIGYVPQYASLFEATVAENIARLGEVDADKVVAAAQLVGMHEVILSFPQGYDTVLLNGEFELSGGQAQRLLIARAMYGKPALVVMDEPNANLDDAAEQALLQAIQAMKKNQSTIVFSAHRPKLIALADYILVIEQGRQVAFGPAAEVLGLKEKPTAQAQITQTNVTQPGVTQPGVAQPGAAQNRPAQAAPQPEAVQPAKPASASLAEPNEPKPAPVAVVPAGALA